MKARTQLMDEMIHLYSMENPLVIEFCKMCERLEVNEANDKMLNILVEAHKANPLTAEQLEALE